MSDWKDFTGKYTKCWYDIKVKGNKMHNQMWPNAGFFHGEAKRIPFADVLEFKRSDNQDFMQKGVADVDE